MMTIQEFNEKYNCMNYSLKEIEDYDPEYDDYRYLMTHTYKDWTHPEAAFNNIEEAEKYIEWIEKKKAEEKEEIMNKQFNSNQELNKFACNYVRNNYDLSKSYFASQFGIINDPLDWLGSWEEYARIIINAGYNIENLRSGLCDEFLDAYDKLKEQI